MRLLSFIGCSKRTKNVVKFDDAPLPEIPKMDRSIIFEPSAVTVVPDTEVVTALDNVSTVVTEHLENLPQVNQAVQTMELPGQWSDSLEAIVKEFGHRPIHELLKEGMGDQILTAMNPEYISKKVEVEEKPVTETPVPEAPKRTSHKLYKHPLWPSPRPVNFVRHMVKIGILSYKKWEGRLTHEKALDALAFHAQITVDELLTVDPITYIKTRLNYSDSQLKSFTPIAVLMPSLVAVN